MFTSTAKSILLGCGRHVGRLLTNKGWICPKKMLEGQHQRKLLRLQSAPFPTSQGEDRLGAGNEFAGGIHMGAEEGLLWVQAEEPMEIPGSVSPSPSPWGARRVPAAHGGFSAPGPGGLTPSWGRGPSLSSKMWAQRETHPWIRSKRGHSR